MALTTVESIETALTLIDAKKDNLKKAFQNLQSHSTSLSSFNITWPDLDSYFTSLQSEIHQNFATLQKTLDSSSQTQKPKCEKQKNPSDSDPPVPSRPELKSLCEKMDVMGLRKYVMDRTKEMTAIRVELADAFKHASDPGLLVLDSLEGFCVGKMPSESRLRTACVVLLEEFMRAELEIGAETRKRARAVAVEWKEKLAAGTGGDGDEDEKDEKSGIEKLAGLERLGYLLILAAYKLYDDGVCDVNEMMDYVVSVAKYRQAVNLCRYLGLESRMHDVIQKIITKGKQLIALKFIYEFELTDKFPPVQLLKAYVTDSKKIAQNVRKIGNNSRQALNEAGVKEINALKSVIKCIKDHDLESQYPINELVARTEKLEKEQADRKRPAAATVPKPQQKQPKQNGKKRTRTAAGPSAVKRKIPANSVVPLSQPPFLNRASLHTDNAVSYLGRPAGPYGVAGPFVPAAPYMGSSADYYGLSGATPGFSGNLNLAASMPYPSETHAQPGHYDRAVGYVGYDVPPQPSQSSQYHPVYYAQ